MRVARRQLLRGLLAAGVSGAASAPSRARAAENAKARTIVVLLRGGVDGLSVAVPWSSARYHDLRPSIRIDSPSGLRLSADAALPPALASLLPMYQRKELRLIRGVRASRSSMHGEAEAELRRQLASAFGPPVCAPLGDAPRLRQELAAPANSSWILNSDGWDTHLGQGGGQRGELHDRLAELARDVRDLWQSLAVTNAPGATQLVVVSELGRTLHENALSGTDHGDASVMLVIARGQGGRVLGDWGGFERGELAANGGLSGSVELETVLSTLKGTPCALR